jgi:hypothetical protein
VMGLAIYNGIILDVHFPLVSRAPNREVKPSLQFQESRESAYPNYENKKLREACNDNSPKSTLVRSEFVRITQSPL